MPREETTLNGQRRKCGFLEVPLIKTIQLRFIWCVVFSLHVENQFNMQLMEKKMFKKSIGLVGLFMALTACGDGDEDFQSVFANLSISVQGDGFVTDKINFEGTNCNLDASVCCGRTQDGMTQTKCTVSINVTGKESITLIADRNLFSDFESWTSNNAQFPCTSETTCTLGSIAQDTNVSARFVQH